MSNPGDTPSDPNQPQTPQYAEARNFTHFPCPELFELCNDNLSLHPQYADWPLHPEQIDNANPHLLQADDPSMPIDPTLLVTPGDTPAPADHIMQEQVSPTHTTVAPPIAEPKPKRVHGCTGKTPKFLKPEERPQWNCYRCDQCGFTDKKPGIVTNHIKYRDHHDAWTVGASWVGDDSVKLARGFISGEPIMVRLQRLERECEERKLVKRKREDERAEERNKAKVRSM